MPAPKLPSPRPPDDPAEYQRFLDIAREVGADEDPKALDREFEKVIRAPASKAGRRCSTPKS